jgi:hypothetical protein
MKIKASGILMLGCMIWVSCKTNIASKCGPCPEYAQVIPAVDVRIVDKTTGADLFLSPNSPYKLSDLKITSTYTGNEISLSVDSTQKDNRFIRLLADPSQTFTLKLASLSSDDIGVVLKTDSPKCCPFIKVSSITLDGTPVCNPCTFGQMVTIKK